MKCLIDTHVFLWWVLDDRRLSKRAVSLLKDSENNIYLSVVSGWEIAIKSRLKKIKISKAVDDFVLEHMDRNDMIPLSIQMKHALHVATLPNYHEDPFDRLLIAQAQVEKLPFITMDEKIKNYDVEVVW